MPVKFLLSNSDCEFIRELYNALTKTFVCDIIIIGDNMKINKVEKLKDGKYKIYFDDEFIITYDNVILENNLLYKKEIDDSLYSKMILDTKYFDQYNKVVKYILKRRRSEKEVIEYINKYFEDLKEEDINKIIIKLKQTNLINDLEYCKAFINDKINLGKLGINKIRIELLGQNIPIEIIEQELSNVDRDILNLRLEKMIKKRINSNRKYSNNHLRQKLLSEMINLGYSKDIIQELIDKNLKDEETILKEEFLKSYKIFSKKYEGDALYNMIRKKLLSKGFELYKINELIMDTKKNL